jgi:hypothetical protein
MFMLACARHRVQSILPRLLAFSTMPPKQEEQNNMSDVADMLGEMAERSPIIPEMNSGDQSVYLYCLNFKYIHSHLL